MLVSLCDFIWTERVKSFHLMFIANDNLSTSLLRLTYEKVGVSGNEVVGVLMADVLFLSAFIDLFNSILKRD